MTITDIEANATARFRFKMRRWQLPERRRTCRRRSTPSGASSSAARRRPRRRRAGLSTAQLFALQHRGPPGGVDQRRRGADVHAPELGVGGDAAAGREAPGRQGAAASRSPAPALAPTAAGKRPRARPSGGAGAADCGDRVADAGGSPRAGKVAERCRAAGGPHGAPHPPMLFEERSAKRAGHGRWVR